jgi:hypothetical protein
MSSYVERLRAVAEEVEAHPYLKLYKFKVNPPAAARAFDEVEKKLKAPPAKSIRDFYAEANGLELRWGLKKGLSEDELDRISDKYDDYTPPDDEEPGERESPFARVNLIPIEASIVRRKWPVLVASDDEATVEFQKQTYNRKEFGRRLRPFDEYSTYDCMAFLLEEGVGDPKVMHLSGHYVEWDGSRVTDFQSYMEMVIATRGIVEAREDVYGEYRGDLKRPLVTGADYWTARRIPKLFRGQTKTKQKG